MKTASAGLISFLSSTSGFTFADLYKWTLATGQILLVTPWQSNLVVDGDTYVGGSLVRRSTLASNMGVEVSTLQVTWPYADTALAFGLGLGQLLRNGGFDRATLLLKRVYMPTPGDVSLGSVILFHGLASDISLDRIEAVIDVKSDLELLNIQMPRNVVQQQCGWTLYDTGCGLTKAAYAVADTVASATVSQVVGTVLSGHADGYFSQGQIIFTTGALAGIIRGVSLHASNTLTIYPALPAIPSPGDGFTAYPGCDKTQATCLSKFSNKANFRGFPYVPVPEKAF